MLKAKIQNDVEKTSPLNFLDSISRKPPMMIILSHSVLKIKVSLCLSNGNVLNFRNIPNLVFWYGYFAAPYFKCCHAFDLHFWKSGKPIIHTIYRFLFVETSFILIMDLHILASIILYKILLMISGWPTIIFSKAITFPFEVCKTVNFCNKLPSSIYTLASGYKMLL